MPSLLFAIVAVLAVAHAAAILAPTEAPTMTTAIAAPRPASLQLKTASATLPTPFRRILKIGGLRLVSALPLDRSGDVSEIDAADPYQLLAMLSQAEALVGSDLIKNVAPVKDNLVPVPDALRKTAAGMTKRLESIQDTIREVGKRLANQYCDEAIAQGADIVVDAMASTTDVLNWRCGLPVVDATEADRICAFTKPLAKALGSEYDAMVVRRALGQNPLRCKLAIAVDVFKLYNLSL